MDNYSWRQFGLAAALQGLFQIIQNLAARDGQILSRVDFLRGNYTIVTGVAGLIAVAGAGQRINFMVTRAEPRPALLHGN